MYMIEFIQIQIQMKLKEAKYRKCQIQKICVSLDV